MYFLEPNLTTQVERQEIKVHSCKSSLLKMNPNNVIGENQEYYTTNFILTTVVRCCGENQYRHFSWYRGTSSETKRTDGQWSVGVTAKWKTPSSLRFC
ncbi:hypothetical protein J6590_076990 [Homalodisca vitripennis]|nr:hypothetical protein J6590_076990 [Homalodisca vitripennis]